jgi:SNF2 family DNA or RNA helicase
VKPIIVYDPTSLARVPGLLEPLALKPARHERGLAVKVTKKFPEAFAAWIKSIPSEITLQLKGELASFVSTDVAGRVKLEVSEAEIDWFDLRVVLDVADTTLSPAEIKLLLNAKGRYVRLEGKGWRRLQFDLSDDENDRLARLGLSPRELSAEPQRLHALQLADDAAKKFLPEQQVEQIQRRANELKTRVTPELPAGITAQLRPYQVEGFHFLAYLSANRFGGILADDMGLGKTLQTLAWLLWLRQEQRAASRDAATAALAPILVVCPKSVMDNWHAEAAQFTPGLRVRVWSACELDALHRDLGAADLHVLNYSQLRMLGENLAQVRWLAVILDEGQYIKNPNSQTAQVARALRAEHRLVLSGTPIENRLMDLWSLMAFAMPGVLSSRAQFGRLYDAKDDPYARRRLASRVRPFLLRRTKTQVAKDLPDRIEEDLFCEIEGEQQTLYRAELKRAQQLLLGVKTQKELAQFQFNFLASLLRLRQVCCDPRLINPDSVASSAKREALIEQLEPLMEEGHKVLVFSQFVELLNLLRPTLAERGWPLFYLAGATENRGDLVREFQAAKGAAVFLISLKAGGFGLNLTAASYVILFDPWWNPAVEAQAIDRTHRIGQNNKVIAYRLLIKNSIEEKIRALQKQKKALAEDVLGEEKFAQSLTLQDLQFLFAD